MRTTINTLFALAAMALVSCNSKRARNYQYFPNMYESVGYEAYSSHEGNAVFEDNNTSEALKPVEGTVHRGWLPYDYENSYFGYRDAKAQLKNPLPYTKENTAKGKVLYNIYCAICHGEKGNGKGQLVKTEKILGVPSYDDKGRAITEGSIYHVMYYGINSMGSYASQTSIEDRWQITQYVESLKANLEGRTPRIDKVISHSSAKLMDHHHEGHTIAESHDAHAVDAVGHDVHGAVEAVHEEINHTVEKVKEKVSHSKKSLLQGKSHHSHKETGKK